jgi:ABC-type multidrug transport system ATPase subunit
MNERLEIEGVGARTGARVLLNAISFAVARGETLAVVGPNGAGKTMLLDSIAGLRAHTGTVRS